MLPDVLTLNLDPPWMRPLCGTPLSMLASVQAGVEFYGAGLGLYLLYLSHLQDSELNELRKTIELLKKQNAAAQAAINGVINTPELSCKGNHETRRRHPLSWYSTGYSPCYGARDWDSSCRSKGRVPAGRPFHLLAPGHRRDG